MNLKTASSIVDCIGDYSGSAEFFGAAGYVQRVQPVDVVGRAADRFFGLGFDIDGAAAWVNNRRTGHANLGRDIGCGDIGDIGEGNGSYS